MENFLVKKQRSRTLPPVPTTADIQRAASSDPGQMGSFTSVTKLKEMYGSEVVVIGIGVEFVQSEGSLVPVLKSVLVDGNDLKPLYIYCTTAMKELFINYGTGCAKKNIFPTWCSFPSKDLKGGKTFYQVQHCMLNNQELKQWGKYINSLHFPSIQYSSETVKVSTKLILCRTCCTSPPLHEQSQG